MNHIDKLVKEACKRNPGLSRGLKRLGKIMNGTISVKGPPANVLREKVIVAVLRMPPIELSAMHNISIAIQKHYNVALQWKGKQIVLTITA